MVVHITFIGLCLFVPDPRHPDGPRVHVLLPRSGFGSVHAHHDQVHYAGMGPLLPTTRGFWMDLTALSTGGTMPAWTNVLDVESVVGSPVPADQVTNHPGPEVIARITLPLPDSVQPGERATFEVTPDGGTPGPVSLTHQMTWVYSNADLCTVDWARTRFVSGVKEQVGMPIAGVDGVARIYVEHLPAHVHVTMPGERIEHPRAYYAVARGSGEDPTLVDQPTLPCGQLDTRGEKVRLAETAYNCMLGVSGLG